LFARPSIAPADSNYSLLFENSVQIVGHLGRGLTGRCWRLWIIVGDEAFDDLRQVGRQILKLFVDVFGERVVLDLLLGIIDIQIKITFSRLREFSPEI
jgi:hypothetical protein